jgi:hypothetical protein
MNIFSEVSYVTEVSYVEVLAEKSTIHIKKKQPRYRPGVAQRVPGS